MEKVAGETRVQPYRRVYHKPQRAQVQDPWGGLAIGAGASRVFAQQAKGFMFNCCLGTLTQDKRACGTEKEPHPARVDQHARCAGESDPDEVWQGGSRTVGWAREAAERRRWEATLTNEA